MYSIWFSSARRNRLQLIDSCHDRHLAKTLAASVRRYVNEKELSGLVFATCHDDFIPWLQPDWVFSTQTKELAILCESDIPEVSFTEPYAATLISLIFVGNCFCSTGSTV